MDLGVGQAAVGIDGRVDVGVAEPGTPGLAVIQAALPTVHPPTTAFGDLGLLLHVDVDQLTRVGGLDPTDHPTLAVEIGEPAHSVALEDPVEGGGGHPDPRGQAGWSELVASSEFDDLALHAIWRLCRTAPGTAGTVLQASDPGVLVAPPPLVGGLAGDPHGLGGCGYRPAILDHVAETESALWGEWSITVHCEPPGGCVGV